MEETLYLLLSIGNGNDVNAKNAKGKSPIFYARTPKMVHLLARHPEIDLEARDKDNHTVLESLLRTNGECAKALLSTAISTNGKEHTDPGLVFALDLKLFSKESESEVLSTFLEFGRKSLLGHPLTETFIHLKGSSTNIFFYINIFNYFLYLLSFTLLVEWTSSQKYLIDIRNNSNHHNTIGNQTIGDYLEPDVVWIWWVLYVAFLFLAFMVTLRELLQLINGGLTYFKSSENILEVITLFCTWVYVLLVPWPWGYEVEQIFAAVAMFSAWIEMSLMIGRIPSIGIFTFMMFQVIRQVVKFFLVYLTTLLAFAFAFHLLLIRDENCIGVDGDNCGNATFDQPWSSFLKVKLGNIWAQRFV